jgi:two-component system, response regulator
MLQEVVDILLVEDNPLDAELMMRALRKNSVANPIHHVEDGAEALDFIFCKGEYKERHIGNVPRVILLDLKLPKIGGLEVLRQVKSAAATKHIPIVVVTSSREDPDIKTAYELGANSYVVKPVEFDSFVEAMKNLGNYWLSINEPSR